MGLGRVNLQLVAFLLLSGGVAINLLVLQPNDRPTTARAPSGARVAAVQGAGLDTGSISRTPLPVIEPGPGSAAAMLDLPRGRSEITRAVQRELQIRGYETGGVDGVAGSMTRAAIIGYESDHGMPLTGRPSQELLKRILLGGRDKQAGNAISESQTAEAQTAIRSVQTSLAALGYKPGQIDGRLSPQTQSAIREFEVDQALPETGSLSGPLVARLARLAEAGQIASGP